MVRHLSGARFRRRRELAGVGGMEIGIEAKPQVDQTALLASERDRADDEERLVAFEVVDEVHDAGVFTGEVGVDADLDQPLDCRVWV